MSDSKRKPKCIKCGKQMEEVEDRTGFVSENVPGSPAAKIKYKRINATCERFNYSVNAE